MTIVKGNLYSGVKGVKMNKDEIKGRFSTHVSASREIWISKRFTQGKGMKRAGGEEVLFARHDSLQGLSSESAIDEKERDKNIQFVKVTYFSGKDS